MLITGVSTYVFVLEKMGTIDFVGHSVAGLGSPLTLRTDGPDEADAMAAMVDLFERKFDEGQ